MNSEQKTPVGGRRSERTRREPERYTPGWSRGGKRATTLQEEETDAEDQEVQPLKSPNKEGASFLSRMWPFGGKKSPLPSTLSSYARRRAQAKVELQKKFAVLDKEIIDLQESMELAHCEIESFEEEVKRKTDICEPTHPLHNPEELLKSHQEIAKSSSELDEKKMNAKMAKIRASKRIEAIAIEKKTLEAEAEVHLAEIDEQEEQHLGSDEELSDPEEEEVRKLTKEFEEWKSGCGVSAPTIKDGYSHEKTEFIPNPTSAMDSIVQSLQTQNQALMKVLSSNQPSQSLTDKLLVRQSIGRDLPFFSGRPEEWPSFISTFKRTTTSCGFTDAENVERIRKCLKGDAAKSVERLLVSPESLPKVLQILEEKYGQPEVIVRSMVAKAKLVPSVKEEKPQTMIDFGTTILNLVATIKNLGELEHLNPVLLQELVEKLPSHFRISWEESVVALTHKSTLEDFSEWVEGRVKIACRMCPLRPDENKKEEKKSHANSAKEKEEGLCTTAGLFSAQDKKSPCVFCKKNIHMSRDCYRAEKMTWDEKSKVLREGHLCFRCFTPGHRKDSCKVKIKCAICSGPHVKSMCAELPANQRRIRNEEVQEEQVQAVNITAHNANHTCRGDVLLKTVVVRAIGPKGTSLVRLLFDEGSQLSNVGNATVNAIGCRQVGEEWSRSVLFGGDVTNAKKVKKFEVKLQSLDGKFSEKFVLNETPVICGELPRTPHGPWVQDLKKKRIWISDLEQRSLQSTDVEILIGSNYWGKLVTSKPLQVFEDLNAVNTKFG
ncbi:Xin actin-binding repeat-containing protein 1 [Folsomia candida]|uniref:Xin actin-binding repeat-containing protein 1 n=1 Tax=Folsomia candida TaxID=158441 RepID=A0A226CVG8_FOLCA|nr:Xin actin-binding repeat-containing protein 1 [Folsomia candida]